MTADAICVAVVGVGHMGRHHARIYSEIPQSNLVAVVDSDRDRAGEIAEKFGAAAYTNLDEIPDSVRAATVAVPTEHHLEVASDLLARGIAIARGQTSLTRAS